MLIRVHPEACRERESRHGCLPLHLCVFSMCDTPPPPTPPTPLASPLPQSLVAGLPIHNGGHPHRCKLYFL
jgi:hypothetical protein